MSNVPAVIVGERETRTVIGPWGLHLKRQHSLLELP